MFRYSNLCDDINLCDNKPVCINILKTGDSVNPGHQSVNNQKNQKEQNHKTFLRPVHLNYL